MRVFSDAYSLLFTLIVGSNLVKGESLVTYPSEKIGAGGWRRERKRERERERERERVMMKMNQMEYVSIRACVQAVSQKFVYPSKISANIIE